MLALAPEKNHYLGAKLAAIWDHKAYELQCYFYLENCSIILDKNVKLTIFSANLSVGTNLTVFIQSKSTFLCHKEYGVHS